MGRRLIIVRMPFPAIGRQVEDQAARRRARPPEAEQAGAYWDEVRCELTKTLNLVCEGASLSGVHIFQEGLCVSEGKALMFAREMAAQGNEKYRLILELVDRGAKLQQTEDPELMEQEQRLLREALTAPRVENRVRARRRYEAKARELAATRDAYIAARVDRVVGATEVGVLFIAPEHEVESMLAADFEVTAISVASPHQG